MKTYESKRQLASRYGIMTYGNAIEAGIAPAFGRRET